MSRDYTGAADCLYGLLPDCKERDLLLDLARTGAKFKQHQSGRKRGALSRLIFRCVGEMGAAPTFGKLLIALEFEAMRRRAGFKSIIGDVDRELQQVEILLPGKSPAFRTFNAIEWHFTQAKRNYENL